MLLEEHKEVLHLRVQVEALQQRLDCPPPEQDA